MGYIWLTLASIADLVFMQMSGIITWNFNSPCFREFGDKFKLLYAKSSFIQLFNMESHVKLLCICFCSLQPGSDNLNINP